MITKEEVQQFIREKAYEQKDGRDFYEDLANAFGLPTQDPLTSRIYGHAWETGHSAGYMEVFYHFKDLVYVYTGKS